MKIEESLSRLELSLSTIAGSPILAGRRQGEQDWLRIERSLRNAPAGGLIVVDLAAVEVLSSSYFLAALWPLWHPGQDVWYPLLARPRAPVVDELEFVLTQLERAVWVDFATPGDPPSLFGALDQETQRILELLGKRDEVSAADLHETDPGIGPSAWSNRLSTLWQRRLLARRKEGKRMIYATPWRGHYG